MLIYDFDVHHGNGTEAAFESDPSVLFISSHQTSELRRGQRAGGAGSRAACRCQRGCASSPPRLAFLTSSRSLLADPCSHAAAPLLPRLLSPCSADSYPYTGKVEEVGKGEGQGATINVPLPGDSGAVADDLPACMPSGPPCPAAQAAGQPPHCLTPLPAGHEAILETVEQIVAPAARRFQPDMIIISAGYDAHWRDPLAGAPLCGLGTRPRCSDAGRACLRLPVGQRASGASLTARPPAQPLPACLPPASCQPNPCRPAVSLRHLQRSGSSAQGAGGRAVWRAPRLLARGRLRFEGSRRERGQHVSG